MQINKTLSHVVNGCFNNKDSHSVGFVVRWLEEHCRRLVHPVHRYVRLCLAFAPPTKRRYISVDTFAMWRCMFVRADFNNLKLKQT